MGGRLSCLLVRPPFSLCSLLPFHRNVAGQSPIIVLLCDLLYYNRHIHSALMPSTVPPLHPLLGRCGYTVKFPLLGLPNPSSEWVPLRMALGSKEACATVLMNPATEAPLRLTKGEYTVFEVEYNDCVWYLPCLDSQTSLQQPEVFTVNVRKVPVNAAPKRGRPCITKPGHVVYLAEMYNERGAYGRFSWPAMVTAKDPSWERSEVFDICLDPTPAQRAAPTLYEPSVGPDHAAEAQERKERDKAWRRWAGMSIDAVNEDWLREIHRSAVAAGLRKSSHVFDKAKPLISIRAKDAPNFDVRELEYAICSKKGKNKVKQSAEWKPLPSHAYSEDFVRCTINLLRKEGAKKLFGKDEWPPGTGTD